MNENTDIYGYEDDAPSSGQRLNFGLNQNARMTKFGYNDEAGTDGAEGEALDITFVVNDKDVLYRIYPFRAYSNNEIITDPRNPEYIKAAKLYKANTTHILKAFASEKAIQEAFSKNPVDSFKKFCDVAKSLLPADFDKIPLDLFAEYQYEIKGDNDRTWLVLPKKVKHGKWICKHVPAKSGTWTEVRTEKGIKYLDIVKNEEGEIIEENVHPFKRGEWYVGSNFANQIQEESLLGDADPSAKSSNDTSEWK